ncbi:MAG: biotin--[acetyl-CoA-carboxylase] ligase [Arenicellales bacterium]
MKIDIESLNGQLANANCVAAGKVDWFNRVSSTNDCIMDLDDFHAVVCLAGIQTAGRGRRGNIWRAPYASSILMSIGWRIDPANISGLSLACGIAVRRALKELGVSGVTLKWPNDLFLKGAKLAGILVEVADDKCVVGVGINININEDHFQAPMATSTAWTDLFREGHKIEYQALVYQLIVKLCDTLGRFSKEGFAPFIEEWNQNHLFHLSQVKISGQQTVHGRVSGVSEHGGLMLETKSGIQIIYSGDVSLIPELGTGTQE